MEMISGILRAPSFEKRVTVLSRQVEIVIDFTWSKNKWSFFVKFLAFNFFPPNWWFPIEQRLSIELKHDLYTRIGGNHAEKVYKLYARSLGWSWSDPTALTYLVISEDLPRTYWRKLSTTRIFTLDHHTKIFQIHCTEN